MSDSLNEKVNYILEDSDFNDLPFEERKRIGKYMAEQQILTLHQVINKDKAHTTEAWRKKTTSWLKNCVDTFYKEYRYPADRKNEPTISKMEQVDKDINVRSNSSEKPNNCEDWQDWKDRMWAEAIVTEPTISKMEQVDKDTNVRSKDEPTPWCKYCQRRWENDCVGVAQCIRDMQMIAELYKASEDEPQTERSE